jgi:hypothetical protein
MVRKGNRDNEMRAGLFQRSDCSLFSRERFREGRSPDFWRGSGLQIHPQVSRLFESGRSLTLLPVAAKMALQSAGAISDTPGSPTPAGGALLSTT